MNNQSSLRHFLSYIGKDSATRVFGAFTIAVYVIGVPGMYLVDRYNYSRSPSYVGSAGDTTLIINIALGVGWAAIITFTIFRYRKYIRGNR